ncbi:MAG TPA: hypothetical protein VI814_01825 [Candidatus Limnocylindria bacterium]
MGEMQTPVIGGHVYCRARHADTDVSVCVTCERMHELRDRTSPPYVVCQIDDLEMAEPDPHFVAWWYEHHRRGR